MLLFTSSVVLGRCEKPPPSMRRRHARACATGAPGGSCTFTASNLALIVVGSQILYDQPPYVSGDPTDPTSPLLLDSNVVLDAVNGNKAVGRCTLDFQTFLGLCTFSDGTGTFAGFEARVDVDCTGSPCQPWDGTYGFRPKPHR